MRILIGIIALFTFRASLWRTPVLSALSRSVGSEIHKAPADVRVWFNVGVDPHLSKIEVFDASGKQVDKKDTHLDGKSTRLLVVSLPALPPGTYKVHWEAVSADTHRTQNDFKFVLKP